jgi:hypothetical protein
MTMTPAQILDAALAAWRPIAAQHDPIELIDRVIEKHRGMLIQLIEQELQPEDHPASTPPSRSPRKALRVSWLALSQSPPVDRLFEPRGETAVINDGAPAINNHLVALVRAAAATTDVFGGEFLRALAYIRLRAEGHLLRQWGFEVHLAWDGEHGALGLFRRSAPELLLAVLLDGGEHASERDPSLYLRAERLHPARQLGGDALPEAPHPPIPYQVLARAAKRGRALLLSPEVQDRDALIAEVVEVLLHSEELLRQGVVQDSLIASALAVWSAADPGLREPVQEAPFTAAEGRRRASRPSTDSDSVQELVRDVAERNGEPRSLVQVAEARALAHVLHRQGYDAQHESSTDEVLFPRGDGSLRAIFRVRTNTLSVDATGQQEGLPSLEQLTRAADEAHALLRWAQARYAYFPTAAQQAWARASSGPKLPEEFTIEMDTPPAAIVDWQKKETDPLWLPADMTVSADHRYVQSITANMAQGGLYHDLERRRELILYRAAAHILRARGFDAIQGFRFTDEGTSRPAIGLYGSIELSAGLLRHKPGWDDPALLRHLRRALVDAEALANTHHWISATVWDRARAIEPDPLPDAIMVKVAPRGLRVAPFPNSPSVFWMKREIENTAPERPWDNERWLVGLLAQTKGTKEQRRIVKQNGETRVMQRALALRLAAAGYDARLMETADADQSVVAILRDGQLVAVVEKTVVEKTALRYAPSLQGSSYLQELTTKLDEERAAMRATIARVAGAGAGAPGLAKRLSELAMRLWPTAPPATAPQRLDPVSDAVAAPRREAEAAELQRIQALAADERGLRDLALRLKELVEPLDKTPFEVRQYFDAQPRAWSSTGHAIAVMIDDYLIEGGPVGGVLEQIAEQLHVDDEADRVLLEKGVLLVPESTLRTDDGTAGKYVLRQEPEGVSRHDLEVLGVELDEDGLESSWVQVRALPAKDGTRPLRQHDGLIDQIHDEPTLLRDWEQYHLLAKALRRAPLDLERTRQLIAYAGVLVAAPRCRGRARATAVRALDLAIREHKTAAAAIEKDYQKMARERLTRVARHLARVAHEVASVCAAGQMELVDPVFRAPHDITPEQDQPGDFEQSAEPYRPHDLLTPDTIMTALEALDWKLPLVDEAHARRLVKPHERGGA